eukprot:scaffold24788_cov71-Phaeocystis_antarctica.AAC.2
MLVVLGPVAAQHEAAARLAEQRVRRRHLWLAHLRSAETSKHVERLGTRGELAVLGKPVRRQLVFARLDAVLAEQRAERLERSARVGAGRLGVGGVLEGREDSTDLDHLAPRRQPPPAGEAQPKGEHRDCVLQRDVHGHTLSEKE